MVEKNTNTPAKLQDRNRHGATREHRGGTYVHLHDAALSLLTQQCPDEKAFPQKTAGKIYKVGQQVTTKLLRACFVNFRL